MGYSFMANVHQNTVLIYYLENPPSIQLYAKIPYILFGETTSPPPSGIFCTTPPRNFFSSKNVGNSIKRKKILKKN